MIVGSTIETLEIPHEQGNKIRIRQLSGLELDDAADIKSQKIMRKMGYIGEEAIAAFRNGQPNNPAQLERDPIDEYDWEYIVVHAIESWEGPYYSDIPCTVENKRKLDDRTLKWIVKEIIIRNVVPQGE